MCQNAQANRPCPKGATCNFAHSPMELRQPGMGPMGGPMGPMGPMGGPMGPMGGPMGPMGGPMNVPGGFLPGGGPAGGPNGQVGPAGGRFKTVMCKNVASTGNCGRGNACNFAHSQVRKDMKQVRL